MSVQKKLEACRCECGDVPNMTVLAETYAVVCPGCGARGARSTSLDEALYFWLEGKRDPEDPRDTDH